MKRTLLTFTAIVTLFFGACKKDNNNKPNDGGNTGGDTYQPVTANSTWKYKNTNTFDAGTDIDTTTNTMTAGTKKFGDKTYHILNAVTNGDTETTYLGFENHIYSTVQIDNESEQQFQLEYLNDNAAVGATWTKALAVEGAEAQVKTTIAEKDITKSVLGKGYNNVIHSVVEVQFKQAGQFKTELTQDFYVAKGVGVIYITAKTPTKQITKSELMSYNIK
jgi:hypothetical protein